jgi:hypothetical protein
MLTDMAPVDVFTVRFPDPGDERDEPAEVQVQCTVDHVAKTITYQLPDGTRTTLDVVTARALQMILWGAVFGSLQPSGPHLRVERSYLAPT